MKISVAIWIDKYIIRFINLFLNVFVRLAGKLMQLNHDLTKPFKTIAVCKFKGMGSMVQSTAMLATLKKNYPGAEIIFITTNSNRNLASRLPGVSKVISLNDKNSLALLVSFFPFVFRLWRSKIQLYFDLEIYSNFSSMVTAFSCARNRVGFYLRSENYKLGIYSHMMFYNVNSPVSQSYLQMVRLLPIADEITGSQNISSFPEKIGKSYSEFVLSGNYMIINPNASDLRLERRWPDVKFVELIEKIVIQFPIYKIVLIGSGAEIEYTTLIFEKIKSERVINLAGKTNLDELIFMIENAQLVITNDTGPMHLAFACNKAAVALFGPCSPNQYGMNGKVKILYKSMYCSPCVHEFLVPPCKGNNVCMKSISVDEVMNAASELIANGTELTQVNNLRYTALDGYLPGLVKRQ